MKNIYWAVVLCDLSKAVLREYATKHPNIYADHLTLCFDPTPEQDAEYMKRIGQTVELSCVGYASDNKGEAMVVDGIESRNTIPHITLSCANGVRPSYSNTLLAKGFTSISPIRLLGFIGRYTREGWKYE